MATKGAHQRTSSKRLSGAPPGLLSFVPLSEQKDFYQYLEIQYLYWKKERDRLAYRIRRSITHSKKLNSFNPFFFGKQHKVLQFFFILFFCDFVIFFL